MQRFPFIILPKWQDGIEKTVAKAKKHSLVEIDSIPITKKELDVIATLNKSNLQRIAFTLLCVAKFYNTINPKNQNWANTPDSIIFNMANVTHMTSVKQQMLIRELHDAGVVSYSKVIDNINLKVCIVNENNDPPELLITDFNDLGYQYLKYTGDPSIVSCKSCGKLLKKKTKKLEYCPECLDKRSKEQHKIRQRKYMNLV